MEATGTIPPPPAPDPAEQPPGGAPGRPPLRRSREDRMLFGVCGGLARHLGVDPVLVRIGAVLTLAFGGVGIIAYAAGVLLIPDEGQDEPLLRTSGPLWARVLGGALLALALAAGLRTVFGSGGAWLPLPLLLLGVAILWIGARRRAGAGRSAPRPDDRVGLLAVGVALLLGGILGVLVGAGVVHLDAGAVLGALAIIAGAVIAVSSIWGRPRALMAAGVLVLGAGSAVAATDLDLSGGVGRRVYTVVASSGATRYRLGVGELEVDLRQVHPVGGAMAVDAQLGVGHLLIDVPRGAPVAVDGEAVADQRHARGGFDISRNVVVSEPAARVLVHAHVGMGVIEVR